MGADSDVSGPGSSCWREAVGRSAYVLAVTLISDGAGGAYLPVPDLYEAC